MSRPTIKIGNPHALRKRATISLPACDVEIPIDEYDSPIDAVISQMLIMLASMTGAIADLQTIAATLAPRDAGLLVERTAAVQDAIDRVHAATEQRAAMLAAQAVAPTSVR